MIPNHYSARLSELDLAMAIHIPPGGNWKNIPTSIPSQRLAQIRESYATGSPPLGGRSGEGSGSVGRKKRKPKVPLG